jgi:hypothetical protein
MVTDIVLDIGHEAWPVGTIADLDDQPEAAKATSSRA